MNTGTPEWSPLAMSLWAKSKDDKGRWSPLPVHLMDTAEIAERLWDEWLPSKIKTFLTSALGDDVRELVCYASAIHDIGKATPPFQEMDAEMAAMVHSAGFTNSTSVTRGAKGSTQYERQHHTATGQVYIESIFRQHGIPEGWASLIGAHHGTPITALSLDGNINEHGLRSETLHNAYFGDKELWRIARGEINTYFWDRYGMESNQAIRHEPDPAILMLISGFIITSDWIASNTFFFPLTSNRHGDRVNRAWSRVGMPSPWVATKPPSFEDRFGFPPRPMQSMMMDAAWEVEEPSLFILEAPMGEGKTEAALYASEVLAHRFGCGGVSFALPTQASTNNVFERFVTWMEQLDDDALRVSSAVWLGHSKSRLNTTYQTFKGNASGCCGYGEKYHFLDKQKVSPLSTMAVTTVDQVISCGLDARHQMLRHLGFAGKVVIIDEVHAYDDYMRVYLEASLSWLGSYGVPVILLSATLPPSQRASLIEAYGGSPEADVVANSSYPLLTVASPKQTIQRWDEDGDGSRRSTRYVVEHVADRLDAVERQVRSVVEKGGNVLVIRNTVKRACETADALSKQYPVLLAHSRFIAADRARIDQQFVDTFGTNAELPSGRVVVATQVAEQSLDVDFDMLITDLAPSDAVLQRMGRVFRRTDRAERRVDEAKIVIIDLDVKSEGDCLPYSMWVMAQSEDVLASYDSIITPNDIPVIVRSTYEDDLHPDLRKRHLKETSAARRKAKAGRIKNVAGATTLNGMLRNEYSENSVRDIEPTVEVLFLQQDEYGRLKIPDWVDIAGDRMIDWDIKPNNERVKDILLCSTSIPKKYISDMGEELTHSVPPTWSEVPMLSRVYVAPLNSSGRCGKMRYSKDRGWTITKEGGK